MSESCMATVGEVAKVQSGFAFKSRDWQESGVPVVKIQNVRGGRVDLTGCSFVSEDVAAAASRCRLQRGDVLVTMSGEIGSIGVVRTDSHIVLNQRVGRLELLKDEAAELRYLAYALQDPKLKATMEAIAYGAAQPNISPSLIASLPIWLPAKSSQRCIAGILETFDDLIENNRRRVEVLEEMARAIYREWFVKFRYPGHSDVPMTDSALGPIPERWMAGTIGDVLELKYGKALKADARRGGGVAVVSSAGVVGWHDEMLVDGPAIVVGRKGNVGSVHWVDGPCWPIDTAYYVSTDLPLRFVAEQLRRSEFTNSHAAVPGLSREAAYARPFLVPPSDLLASYQTLADSFGTQAATLSWQSENLRALRDLLLPKLVTGQIDVSTLDLDVLLDEAVA
jgi:type I restriction enzyme S subunit